MMQVPQAQKAQAQPQETQAQDTQQPNTRLCNPHELIFIQSRAKVSSDLTEEYRQMMENGIIFDPCNGIEDEHGQVYIWDGFHRGEAAKKNGCALLVVLEPGTQQDAIWKATAANKKHGLRRNRADIEKAVKDALRHPNGVNKSNREIASWVGCDHKTVGAHRKNLIRSGEIPQMQKRNIIRGKQAYQMDISGIVEKYSEIREIQQTIGDYFSKAQMTNGAIRDTLDAIKHKSPEGKLLFNKLNSHIQEKHLICRKSDIRRACANLLEQFKQQQEKTKPEDPHAEFEPQTKFAIKDTASEEKPAFEKARSSEETPQRSQLKLEASAILEALEQNRGWVNVIVKQFANSRFWPYPTTDHRIFRGIAIRKPIGEKDQSEPEWPKRYDMDAVAVIRVNNRQSVPILAGIEVKVLKSDLMGDPEMYKYITSCDTFYLAVPANLVDDAKHYLTNSRNTRRDIEKIGILAIAGLQKKRTITNDNVLNRNAIHPATTVRIIKQAGQFTTKDRERKELITELLMKTLWKDSKEEKRTWEHLKKKPQRNVSQEKISWKNMSQEETPRKDVSQESGQKTKEEGWTVLEKRWITLKPRSQTEPTESSHKGDDTREPLPDEDQWEEVSTQLQVVTEKILSERRERANKENGNEEKQENKEIKEDEKRKVEEITRHF